MSNIKCQTFLFLLFITALFNIACKEKTPIPEEKFIKVYVDLLVMQDTTTAEKFSPDSVKSLVFKRHNISSEQYDGMIDYYNSQPEKWTTFFDSATAYVEKLKKKAETQP